MFEFIIPILEKYGLFAVLASIFLEGLMIPLPSFIVVPFGGFLASQGYFSWITLAILGTILNFISSTLIFVLGKKILPFLHKLTILEKQFTMSENFFNLLGEKAVAIGRMLPAIRMFVPITAAISKFSLKKFLVINAVTTTLWNFIFSFGGFVLGENWHLIDAYGKYLTMLGLVALPVAYIVYKKAEKRLLN